MPVNHPPDRRKAQIFEIGEDKSPYSTQMRRVEEDIVEHVDDDAGSEIGME